MAKRKKAREFTADELKALKKRLIEHRTEQMLAVDVAWDRFQKDLEFDDACDVRDAIQPLVKTCLILKTTINLCIGIAEKTGEPQIVPYLDECGLDLETLMNREAAGAPDEPGSAKAD